LGPRIAPAVVIEPAVRADPTIHERFNGRQHLFGVERRQPTDPVERPPASFTGEDAVRHERVEVDVQVERAAESLNHHDRAAAATLDAHVAGTIGQDPTDAANHDGSHGPAQGVVPGELVPQSVRHTQHPLPDGNVRQDPVDEVCCPLGHAAAPTTRTERAPLTRKGHQAVESTAAATKAREAADQPAAAEEITKGLLDELWQALAVTQPRRLGAERFEVLTDDPVQHSVAGRPLLIARRR
jgi:hypothetical protein